MALSEYELQRARNMVENQAVLRRLGLADDNSLEITTKPPPRTRKINVMKKPPRIPQELRRSGRVAQTPTNINYAEGLSDFLLRHRLSDEFCRWEERHADRPTRARAVPRTYEEEQGRELVEREQRNLQRRRLAAQQRATRRPQVDRPILPVSYGTVGWNMAPQLSGSLVPAYPVDGEKRQCNRCLGWFCLNKTDGQMRSHTCLPAGAVLPSM